MLIDEKIQEYYKIIDNYIKKLKITDIDKIYGGVSYRELKTREKEHKDEDSRFQNLNIYEILNVKNKQIIKKCEDYLIEKLNKKFKSKILNKVQGGGGITTAYIYYLYVMY